MLGPGSRTQAPDGNLGATEYFSQGVSILAFLEQYQAGKSGRGWINMRTQDTRGSLERRQWGWGLMGQVEAQMWGRKGAGLELGMYTGDRWDNSCLAWDEAV